MKSRLFYFFMPILILACLCGSSKSNDGAIQALEFSVNDSLLQNEVTDSFLKIAFRPPKNWNSRPNDTLVKLLGKMTLDQNKAQGKAHMYCDTVSQSIFLLNHLAFLNTKNGEEYLKKIGEVCKKQVPQCEIHTFIFLREPFLVHQIIANMGKMVMVSLFFTSDESLPFGMHYLLPFATFSEKMKVVESVVGSMKVLSDKKNAGPDGRIK